MAPRGQGPSPQLSQTAGLSGIPFIVADTAQGSSLSRWILRPSAAGWLPRAMLLLGCKAESCRTAPSGHAAAQLQGKVLHMLLQGLPGVGLGPLLPRPLLLQLGQP